MISNIFSSCPFYLSLWGSKSRYIFPTSLSLTHPRRHTHHTQIKKETHKKVFYPAIDLFLVAICILISKFIHLITSATTSLSSVSRLSLLLILLLLLLRFPHSLPLPRAARQSVTVPRLERLIGGWGGKARQGNAMLTPPHSHDKAGLCAHHLSRNLILVHGTLSTTDDFSSRP